MAIALLLAAGKGHRLGSGAPKAHVDLAGRPMFQWSLSTLRGLTELDKIVLALPPASAGADSGHTGAGLGEAGAELGQKEGAVVDGSGPAVWVVAGGNTRSESARLALVAAGPGDPILIHDAARPLVRADLLKETLDALAADKSLDGAIAAAPVTDTVKRVSEGIVVETLDRAQLWAVQTPQVFRRGPLERALDAAPALLAKATDDAWLLERMGARIGVVRSDDRNLKVTTPMDLALAALMIATDSTVLSPSSSARRRRAYGGRRRSGRRPR